MVSVYSNLNSLQTQDIELSRQIWISQWANSGGNSCFKTFGTQREAIEHLLAVILPSNNCCYLRTLWACATVSGGINRGEIDLRLIISN